MGWEFCVNAYPDAVNGPYFADGIWDRNYMALPRRPAAMKLAMSSERLIPFFFANASAALRSSPSRETLTFFAPVPIFGRPRPRLAWRQSLRPFALSGRVLSITISSYCLVA